MLWENVIGQQEIKNKLQQSIKDGRISHAQLFSGPEGSGTLATDTATFGSIVFAIILIVAALAFFPALTLGPIADYFSTPKF